MRRSYTYVLAALLGIALVLHALTQFIDQDEEQYVSAAYFAQNLTLYLDFVYLQPPVYPLILSKLFLVFSDSSKFLIARLLSGALAISTVVVFFNLAARLSESKKVALALAALFASSPVMLVAYGSTRNDVMPVFFGLCGVWTLVGGFAAQKNRSRVCLAKFFLGGIFMALAVGTKVTAAFIPLAAIPYLLFRQNPAQGSRRTAAQLLALTLGAAVGSVPTIYFAFSAFDNFIYANFTYHLTGPVQYYTDTGQPEFLTVAASVRRMLLLWSREPELVAATFFLLYVAFIAWLRGSLYELTAELLSTDRLFIILIMLAAIPFIFLPRPAAGPYLVPMVPYVLLSCAAIYPASLRSLERGQLTVFVLMTGVVLLLQIARFAIQTTRNATTPLWTVTQVHELSTLIVGYLKDAKLSGPVATTYPMLVFDAGGEVYPQFAATIYFFRSGDHLAPERVRQLNGISPLTLPMILHDKPPAAVFIDDAPLDRPLLNWARRACYVEVPHALSRWRGGPYIETFWQPRLFVRPSTLPSDPCPASE
jgi:4-amino-4-deoxy-L-arabinose transferase-like glycosyltransferase